MNKVDLACQDERRRQIARDAGFNGIDFIEVLDDSDQRELCVHFFGQVPQKVGVKNVHLDGGTRIRDIKVVRVEPHPAADPEIEGCLRVVVDKPGDFSPYTLQLTGLEGFDPRYTSLEFSFKVGCASDLDCQTYPACPPEDRVEPEINYLAKDYTSFRQLILDRLALLMPDWQERHVPDLGITLVEALAYAGDYLSYYQDAVGTEAYLGTARQRISIRRHVQLVDYPMHEGCNARTWLCLWTSQNAQLDPLDTFFITHSSAVDQVIALLPPETLLQQRDLSNLPASAFEVFEPWVKDPAKPIQLYQAHNQVSFYTWDDAECCLPVGATRATLLDGWENSSETSPTQQAALSEKPSPHPRKLKLSKGDVLIFEEVKGPLTGDPADADPAHRWAVRLDRVTQAEDPLHHQPLVEIEWDAADALPFPLCISSRLPAPDCSLVQDVSVACANVLLVDHGLSLPPEDLGGVPILAVAGECECEGSAVDLTQVAGKLNPTLQQTALTFRQAVSFHAPASYMLLQDPHQALPNLNLVGLPAQDSSQVDPADPKWVWVPQRNLLNSRASDRHFVAEMDNDGYAHLRFGDGDLGRKPAPGSTFTAHYRIGNGPQGNVGAETIAYVVTRQEKISGLTLRPCNPFPAQGGTNPEPVSDVRLVAPMAGRKVLERAITADDYATLANLNPRVQRAEAVLRWTGSWYEAQVEIDPLNYEGLGPELHHALEAGLYPFRRMGHDLEVRGANYVPLRLELEVCVLPHYLRGHVEAALLDRFSNRKLPGGATGLFYPDNLTFGQGISVSAIIAAAQAVDGVLGVAARLNRLNGRPEDAVYDGRLPLSPLEVARLDNDPNFPEHGILTLKLSGGR